MKKLLIIGFLFSLVIGCKKQAATPAPTTNNVTASPISYALPTALDSCLVGNWALDTTQIYVNGNYINSTYYNDPVNCHMNLLAVVHDTQNNWKNSSTGLDCNNVINYWRTTTGKLDLTGALYQVISITPTKLVMLYGTTGTGGTGTKYYLHK